MSILTRPISQDELDDDSRIEADIATMNPAERFQLSLIQQAWECYAHHAFFAQHSLTHLRLITEGRIYPEE